MKRKPETLSEMLHNPILWDRWVATDRGIHRRVTPYMPNMNWLQCPQCGEAPCVCERKDHVK